MLEKKTQIINKRNQNRTDSQIEPGINYIKEIRGGKNHSKFRKINTELIGNDHVVDQENGYKYYKTHVRKKRKFQNPKNVRFKLKPKENLNKNKKVK